MGSFLSGWAGFFGLLLLGWLLPRVVVALFRRAHDRIDRALPDNMPLGAGAWLVEQANQRAMSLRVFGGRDDWAQIDAYIPHAHTIVLSRPGDKRRDASFWAIAAHELGHALVYQRAGVLRWLFSAARIVSRSAAYIATMLIFANILYARRDIDAAGFALLYVSLGAYAFVLVDELLASAIAGVVLGRDPRVDRRAMWGAVGTLCAAFMTYAGGFVAHVVLIAQRGFIIAQIEQHRHFEPGPPIGGVGFLLAGLLSVLLVFASLGAIVRELRRPGLVGMAEVKAANRRANTSELGRSLLGLGIVWLIWDQPLGPSLALVCVAGLLGARLIFGVLSGIGALLLQLVALVVVVVCLLPIFILIGWFRRDRPRPSTVTPAVPVPALTQGLFGHEVVGDPAEAAGRLHYETASQDEIDLELARHRPWNERLAAFGYPLLHIFLAVAWVCVFLAAP